MGRVWAADPIEVEHHRCHLEAQAPRTPATGQVQRAGYTGKRRHLIFREHYLTPAQATDLRSTVGQHPLKARLSEVTSPRIG
jgi:hypothetical protein